MSPEPQAGGRVGWELGRRGEEGPGQHLAGHPVTSLTMPATPPHQTLSRAQASPLLSVWAKGGQAEACPPQGNQPSPQLPAGKCPPGRLAWGRNAVGEPGRSGESLSPLRRKY